MVVVLVLSSCAGVSVVVSWSSWEIGLGSCFEVSDCSFLSSRAIAAGFAWRVLELFRPRRVVVKGWFGVGVVLGFGVCLGCCSVLWSPMLSCVVVVWTCDCRSCSCFRMSSAISDQSGASFAVLLETKSSWRLWINVIALP